jgi:hypothetical protein
MVEAKHQSYHAQKPKDYRPALLSIALYHARLEAKERIKAEGKKIAHYSPVQITALAQELLCADPQLYITKARDMIADLIAQGDKMMIAMGAANRS